MNEPTTEFITNKLLTRLSMFGIGPKTAERIVHFFGVTETLPTIKENPYKLMLVPGISFRRADNIAINTGVSKTDPRRQSALVMHILEEATNSGHAYLPIRELEKRAKKEEVDVIVSSIIPDLVNEGMLVVEGKWPVTPFESTNIYLTKYHVAEIAVAEHLKRRAQDKSEVKAIVNFGIHRRSGNSNVFDEKWDAEQRNFVDFFHRSNVVVLTGGPGTGKTTVTKAVCDLLDVVGLRFALCALTGKAAKRCSELTGQSAYTVHKFLKARPALASWGFNSLNKIQGLKYVICDESSMLDIRLAYRLLEALPDETRIIFIGDVDQLQPVGPGSFFKDLIRSNTVPVFRLKTNHRQGKGSLIADNALAINRGELKFNFNNEDFFYIEAENAPVIREQLIHIIDVLRDKLGYTDFVHDVQVLTPQKRTSVGTEKLNEMLRFRMNPEANPDEDFSVGDKVMQIRNDYDLNVFNGFVGRIVSVRRGEYLIDFFDTEDDKLVDYPIKNKKSLIHAYACTVHKYQGSEVKVGIIVVSSTHTWMLTRNLIYTGITRCKEVCILVGDKMGLKKAIKNNREQERYSRLLERLQAPESDGTETKSAFRLKR